MTSFAFKVTARAGNEVTVVAESLVDAVALAVAWYENEVGSGGINPFEACIESVVLVTDVEAVQYDLGAPLTPGQMNRATAEVELINQATNLARYYLVDDTSFLARSAIGSQNYNPLGELAPEMEKLQRSLTRIRQLERQMRMPL